MSSPVYFPEASFGLRVLFRGLPGVVRKAVFTSNLQRTGCIKCGVGPHSVYDCPHLNASEANELSLGLYKQWATVIGEELMLLGAASTSASYIETAIPRISARSNLPRRRPRTMKVAQTKSGLNQCSGLTSPLLPLPTVAAAPAQVVIKVAAPPAKPTGSSRSIPAAKASPKSVESQAQPKPPSPRLEPPPELPTAAKHPQQQNNTGKQPAKPAGSSRQSEKVLQPKSATGAAAVNATNNNVVPISAFLVRNKQPARPSKPGARLAASADKQQDQNSTPANDGPAPQSSPTESEIILSDLNTEEDWENDNVHMDRRRLAGVHRVAGDLVTSAPSGRKTTKAT